MAWCRIIFSVVLGINLCDGYLFGSIFQTSLVKFDLFTRRNNDLLSTGQKLEKDLSVIKKSNFNSSLPTKVFLHGWFNAGWYTYVREMRREMLKQVDCNFLVADWSFGSINPVYSITKRIAQQAGQETADLLIWMNKNLGLQYKDVHVIGHSLGAQAAGALGKAIQKPKVSRISGLDPAQMGFNMSDPNDTLGPEDAEFVDITHTTFVSPATMGHVDFFPNGGDLGFPVTWLNSHMKAVYIYTETINSKCPFTAYKCASYRSLQNGGCPASCESSNVCNTMGYYASPDRALGSLYLHIKESEPYC